MTDDKPIRIVRVPHSKDRPYFSMARSTAQDIEISYEALGLLTYLLSKPDSWEINIKDVAKRSTKYKAYKMLRELRKAGYMKLEKEKGEGRFSQWVYQIFETSQLIEFQQVENQVVENQHTQYLKNGALENKEKKPRTTRKSASSQSSKSIQTPSKEGMGNGTKKRSEKSPKTVKDWLTRLSPVRAEVVEMLKVCYDGWDNAMMTPDNSLTVHQLENYITNTEEYIRLGGKANEVGQVYEYVADLVDYTIAPKTIAGYYLRWKASKKAEDSDKADKAYESAKAHVETLMTDEQRKKRAEQMKADRIAIFGEKTA